MFSRGNRRGLTLSQFGVITPAPAVHAIRVIVLMGKDRQRIRFFLSQFGVVAGRPGVPAVDDVALMIS